MRAFGHPFAAIDIDFWGAWKQNRKKKKKGSCKSNFMDLLSAPGFITAVLAILACRTESLIVVGIVCSSWVSVSRGTTNRTFCAPMGDLSVKCVRAGNVLAARQGYRSWKLMWVCACFTLVSMLALWCVRLAWLLYLIHVRGSTFLIEQPNSSLLFRRKRLQQVARRIRAARLMQLLYILYMLLDRRSVLIRKLATHSCSILFRCFASRFG